MQKDLEDPLQSQGVQPGIAPGGRLRRPTAKLKAIQGRYMNCCLHYSTELLP
jgi:hypothetical protein